MTFYLEGEVNELKSFVVEASDTNLENLQKLQDMTGTLSKYALDDGMEGVQERFQNKLNIIDERLENIKSGFDSIIESLHKES